MSKIIIQSVFLLLSFLVFILLGWYWLERVNVLKTDLIVPLVTKFSTRNNNDVQEIEISQDTLLLDSLRLEKKEEQLRIMQLDLSRQAQTLDNKTYLLEQEATIIENTKQQLTEQQNNINQISKQFENKNERVMQVAKSLINMPPQNAVDILVVFDDELLLDILATVNQLAEESGNASVVPYWLSLMDATRAGEVQKKLVYK